MRRSVLLATVLLVTACDVAPRRAEEASALQSQSVVEAKAVGGERRDEPAAESAAEPAPLALGAVDKTENVAADMTLPSAAMRDTGLLSSAMIIRTGAASVEVDSLPTAIVRVRAIAQQAGGYVGNMSVQGSRGQTRSATLELKVPAARFDDVVSGLRTLGHTESVNTQAEDVGEEYVDLGARVTNSRRLEQRLIDLLATRTGKLRDVLDVERELARVRGEIERQEGRMRYLRTRASVSTLSVTLHEPFPIVGQYQGSNVLAEAMRRAWRNFVNVIAAGIASFGALLPLALVGLVVAYLVRRRMRGRRSPPSSGEPPRAAAA